jgi:hypothetical protein
MRRFPGPDGRVWEVVVGRESWGVFVALFIPVEGGQPVRQTTLLASGYEEASTELERLDEAGLCDLLARSVTIALGA